MSMWQRIFRSIPVVVGYFAAYMVVILLLAFRVDSREYLLLRVGITIGVVIVFGIAFVWHLRRLTNPPQYREAHEHGLAATGHVLEIQPTGWKNIRGHWRGRAWRREVSREFRMRMNIALAGQAPYEAIVTTFLPQQEAPHKGAVLNVRVHPQKPDVVVLADSET